MKNAYKKVMSMLFILVIAMPCVSAFAQAAENISSSPSTYLYYHACTATPGSSNGACMVQATTKPSKAPNDSEGILWLYSAQDCTIVIPASKKNKQYYTELDSQGISKAQSFCTTCISTPPGSCDKTSY